MDVTCPRKENENTIEIIEKRKRKQKYNITEATRSSGQHKRNEIPNRINADVHA